MPGETSLPQLLRTLKPVLHPTTFVFSTVPANNSDLLAHIPPSDLQMTFREAEGLTVITPLQTAERHGLDFFYRSRMITLDVHSSLEAVGFMAAVSRKLAEAGCSVNPVSGYYHDHVFVKEDEAEKVVGLLQEMAAEAEEAGEEKSGA